MTRTFLENLKEGDLLTSETRDAVILTSKHLNDAWYVKDCEYSDEKQDYIPVGSEYLLTLSEIRRDFQEG